jgi:hypothetical protein
LKSSLRQSKVSKELMRACARTLNKPFENARYSLADLNDEISSDAGVIEKQHRDLCRFNLASLNPA